jgi:hypothetical protein
MLSGNKGEWSELYALIKVIADGKLFQAKEDLKKDLESFYLVIKGYKSEFGYELLFERTNQIQISQISESKKTPIFSLPIDDFEGVAKDLFHGILNGTGKSFRITKIEEFLEKCHVKKLKADSNSKADLKLRIYDHRMSQEADLGFSVKSLIGGNSTLFNAGTGNNFIFKIKNVPQNFSVDEFNTRTYNPPGGKKVSKISYRLEELRKAGLELEFSGIQSKQLMKNLRMIDGDLPSILAWALYYRYLNRESSLTKVCEILENLDPLNFYEGEGSSQKLYEYKIMRFLTEATMGMTSETPWNGDYNSFGGVVFTKADGDVVCFHIYDFNILRRYLINNTVFEQPATGENSENPGYSDTRSKKNFNYGWLYKREGGMEFKINLQIRFK